MSLISDRLNKVITTLNSNTLAKVAYDEFLLKTPEKTGNAKRNTRLVGNQIKANYAYADVLDQGRGYRDGQMRGSEQAPVGMTQPALEALRQYVFQQTGIRLK